MKYGFILSYRHVLIIALMAVFTKSYGQDYFRIKTDFSVKSSSSDGTKNLTRGIIYYDKHIKDLIYDISFPNIEKWISKDTSLYKYSNDTLVERVSIPSINEFTVFHLALNSGLTDFGLRKSPYKIGKVEKKEDLVISYWQIPDQATINLKYVVIAKKDNRLESVIMIGKDDRILSKQFFQDYLKVDAFEFPGKIVQIFYDSENNESYQLTEFSNVKINDLTNSMAYEFKL